MDREEKIVQPKIASREVTTHILKAFGLHMSKKLGQNFLIDAGIVQGIVDAAEIEPGDRVLEIGPGMGVLTQFLLEKPHPPRLWSISSAERLPTATCRRDSSSRKN